MEDLLILGGFCLLFIACVYAIIRLTQKRKLKNERMRILNEEIMEAGRKAQQKRNLQNVQLAIMNTPSKPVTVVPGKTYTVQQPASKSDDSFMDGVMMATVLNQMMHSDKNVIQGTVTKNLDTNEVTYKDTGPSYVDSSPKSSWSSSDSSPSSSWSSSSSDSSSSWSSSSSDSYSSPSSDW